MKLNNYFYTTTITYLFIFLTPLITYLFPLSPNQLISLTTGAYLVGAIALLVIAKQLIQKPLVETGKKSSFRKILLWGIAGVFLAFLAQSMALLIENQLLGLELASENTQNNLLIVKKFPLYIAAVTIGGPIMEELVFRRALTGVLTQAISPIFAGIISSIAFAIIHFDGHLLLYFMMGMTFFFLYQKTGSIWTSIIAHCGMNSFVIISQLLLK